VIFYALVLATGVFKVAFAVLVLLKVSYLLTGVLAWLGVASFFFEVV
jgi:hypothetical protein